MQNGPTHHTPRPACDATSSSIVSSQARALVSRQHAHSRAVMGTAMPRQHAHSRAVMGTSNAELLPALTTALLPALTTALTPWRPLPYLSPPWPPPPPPPWRPRPQRLWPWRQLTRGHPHRRRHRDSIQDRTRPTETQSQIEIEIEIETQYQILPSHGGHSAMRARNQPHCWHALLIRPRPIGCPWWACKSVHA